MPVYVFYYITGEFSKLAYFTLVLPIIIIIIIIIIIKKYRL